jgi:hypothetical protein
LRQDEESVRGKERQKRAIEEWTEGKDIESERKLGLTRCWTGARYADIKWFSLAEVVYNSAPGQLGRYAA